MWIVGGSLEITTIEPCQCTTAVLGGSLSMWFRLFLILFHSLNYTFQFSFSALLVKFSRYNYIIKNWFWSLLLIWLVSNSGCSLFVHFNPFSGKRSYAYVQEISIDFNPIASKSQNIWIEKIFLILDEIELKSMDISGTSANGHLSDRGLIQSRLKVKWLNFMIKF